MTGSPRAELTEYEGVPLSTFYRQYDNSIKGPQDVDLDDYRLEVTGLVENSPSLTCDEVLAHEQETRLATLFCVEGWRSGSSSRVCAWPTCSRRHDLERGSAR